jgi:hypothetical protein
MVNTRTSRWSWLVPPAWRKWRIVLTVEEADEIPERLPRAAAVLVGSPSNQKWIAFDCPCRRHHRVMLNLSRNRTPYWSVLTKSPLTLIPSVDDFSGGQRCHYFLRNGKVRWASNTTQGDRA